MCFMNCIYEDFHGECANPKMMETPMAKCCLAEEDYFDEEEDFDEEKE